MTQIERHHASLDDGRFASHCAHGPSLSERLQQAGMILLSCDESGAAVATGCDLSESPSAQTQREGAGRGVQSAEVGKDCSSVQRRPKHTALQHSGPNTPDGGGCDLTPETLLRQLLDGNGFVRRLLRQAAAVWNEQDAPAAVEAAPGLWLGPIPLTARRKRAGYKVVVIPTARLLESEHFSVLCQAVGRGGRGPGGPSGTSGGGGGADERLMRSMLAQLPLAHERDVPRLVILARYLHEDQMRLDTGVHAMENTGQQLAESYEEISLLYTIIQSMTVVHQPERFVRIACEELLGTLPYAWIGAHLADDPERLKKLSGKLIIAGETPGSNPRPNPGTDPGTNPGTNPCGTSGGPLPSGRLAVLCESLLRQLAPDAPIVLEPERNPDHAAYAALGRTVLVHPISSHQVSGNMDTWHMNQGGASGQSGDSFEGRRVLGMLIAGDKYGADPEVSSVDMKLLGATASHTAIFLENAALYDDLNTMFLGTLEALTASIDAKDRYTCGHSQRVAHLTQQLARSIGMSPEQVRRMHIAGLVHDVGKIGVPEHVLLKPGKLTDEEFAWIRLHPEMGWRILKDIPQLKDILPGVLYHHERWDGRGYPAGLSGEEIPHVARLIGLADSFDAMSSNRTYRSALRREEVLEEIRRCAGTQFDPELAPIFADMDFSEYDRMVVEHRAAGDRAVIPTPPALPEGRGAERDAGLAGDGRVGGTAIRPRGIDVEGRALKAPDFTGRERGEAA